MTDERPQRIQRKRTAGWRMPEGAVYVGRPTKWGNPWCICRRESCDRFHAASARQAAGFYAEAVVARDMADADGRTTNGYVRSSAEIRAALGGRDLACWCPEGRPCHADVLLKIANEEPT